MSSQGAVHASPVLGNTGSGQRGSGHLAVPSAAWWPDSEPVCLSRTLAVERGCG